MKRDETMVAGIEELMRKIESSLVPSIEEHMKSREFDAKKDVLDYLEVKNSLLLSYMIDLTFHIRERLNKKQDEQHLQRLHEMRTTLDKSRPLEKKMRYQLDRLLAATATSASFAAGDSYSQQASDPLAYRPDPDALGNTDDDDSSDDDDDSEDSHDVDADDAMDDLAAAQATLQRARERDENDKDDGLYRAPRLASMPYPKDGQDDGERQKRQTRRMRTTELAQTLRAQYGETPEQEDVHGGTDYGKQVEAARRMTERQAAKTSFEEDNMVRLVTSRKERKARERLLREESSNLAALSDLGGLVRGVSSAFRDEDNEDDAADRNVDEMMGDRYSNGKRKRSVGDETSGRSRKGRSPKSAKNPYQQALYGGDEGKSKAKKR